MLARIAFLLLLLNTIDIYCQEVVLNPGNWKLSPHRFGLFIGGEMNIHNPDFPDLPGVPNCCPQFDDGFGLGMNIGLLYEYKFGSDWLLLIKAGYYDDSGLLSKEEKEVLSVDFQPYDGKFEHSINATLNSIAIKPMIGYRFIDEPFTPSKITLSGYGGFRLGYLTAKDYTQKEEIIDPSDRGKFIDSDSRIRNESSGEIPNANDLNFSLSALLRLEVPLDISKSLALFAEMGYDHQITDFVDERDWTKSSLLLNIGLIYTPVITKEVEIIELDSFPALPGAAISAVGVIDGVEAPKAILKVEEFLTRKMQPLLNYIFFDHADASIPGRYNLLESNKAVNFSIDDLYESGTMDTYYHVLNIVGRRMKDYPESKITLTGCNSGQGFEKNDTDLSRDRARNVADYLTSVWDIDPVRIKIAVRNLPEKPSNVSKDDGIAENRRVEINSDTWEILAPVELSDTVRTVSPPVIRFYPENKSTPNCDKWVINAYQKRMVQKSLFGETPVPEKVDWNINEDKDHIPRFDSPLYVTFQLFDGDENELASADTELPLEQITIEKKKRDKTKDKMIERFSLILFDFDKAELDENNRRIAMMINRKLDKSENVIITGYTDRMGEKDYNEQLSKKRAEALADELDIEPVKIVGLGESVELYDNSLPEGRFYSRTVEVVAETPIEW